MFNRKKIQELEARIAVLEMGLDRISPHFDDWKGLKVIVAANEYGTKTMPLNSIIPDILEACCLQYKPAQSEAIEKKKGCK